MSNYVPFTPSTIDTRPYSGVGGIDTSNRDMFGQIAQAQTLEQMFVDMARKQAELEQFKGKMPSELAKAEQERLNAIAKSDPGYIRQILAGETADARKRVTGADEAAALSQSKVQTQLTADQATQLKATLGMMERSMPFLNSIDPNSLEGTTAYQSFLKTLPPGLVQRLPQRYDANAFTMIREHLVNTVEHAQNLEKEDQKGLWNVERQIEANKGAVAAASVRAGQKLKSDMAAFQDAAAKGNPDRVIMAGQLILNNPEVEEATKVRIRPVVEQAQRMIAQRDASKAPPQFGPGGIVPTTPDQVLRNMQGRQTDQGPIKGLPPGVTRVK